MAAKDDLESRLRIDAASQNARDTVSLALLNTESKAAGGANPLLNAEIAARKANQIGARPPANPLKVSLGAPATTLASTAPAAAVAPKPEALSYDAQVLRGVIPGQPSPLESPGDAFTSAGGGARGFGAAIKAGISKFTSPIFAASSLVRGGIGDVADGYTGNQPAPVAPAPTPAVTSVGAKPPAATAVATAAPAPEAAPATLPTIPLDQEIPREGSGFIRNNQTGDVTIVGGALRPQPVDGGQRNLGLFGNLFRSTALLNEARRQERTDRKARNPEARINAIKADALEKVFAGGALTPEQRNFALGVKADERQKSAVSQPNPLDGSVVITDPNTGTARKVLPAESNAASTVIADLQGGRISRDDAKAKLRALPRDQAEAALKAAGIS